MAAPDPPLEPPAEMFKSQGLRGVLKRWVKLVTANSLEIGLAQQNGAGVLQPGDYRCVIAGHEVGGDAGPAGGADALRPYLVFDPHRDAVHRPPVVARLDFLLRLPRFLQRPFPKHRDEGVELEVKVVDPLQVSLDCLNRRHLSALDEAAKGGCGVQRKFAAGHKTSNGHRLTMVNTSIQGCGNHRPRALGRQTKTPSPSRETKIPSPQGEG